jgi:hypothetical protein
VEHGDVFPLIVRVPKPARTRHRINNDR